MLRFPERQPYTPAGALRQKRYFRILVIFTTLVTVTWEFMQLTGKLVFDPLDLVATMIGAITTILIFRLLRRYSYLPDA